MRSVCVALVAAALALAGCGSDEPRTIDDAEVEQGLEQQLSTSSAKVESASCPSDVEAKQGATMTCNVTYDNGAKGKAKVLQEAPNQYTYTLVPGSVEIPGSAVAKEVEASLAEEGAANAQVTCPSTIIVKVGTTVTCDVSGAQGAVGGTVTFEFSSNDGTVDSSSVDTA